MYDPIDGRIFAGPGDPAGLAVINASSGQPASALSYPVPSNSMVFDPRLDEVFAVGDPWTLTAFNASTLAPVYRNITIGGGPSSIVYDSRDDLLFIAAVYSSDIWVVNPNKGTVIGSPIPAYSNPDDLVYDPTRDRVYVAVHDNNDPTQLGRILALNGSTRSWDPSVNWSVGGGFFSMAIAPSRNWLYVGNYGSSNVSVVNASTGRAVSAGIKVGLGPEDTLYYPPTDSVIVSTEGGTYEINVSTNNVTNSTTPGGGAFYLSFDTKDKTIYSNLGSYVGVFDPRVSLSLRYIQLQYSLTYSTFDAANGNIYVINPTGVNDTSYGSVLAINGTSHRFQHTSFPVGLGAEAIQYDGADGKLGSSGNRVGLRIEVQSSAPE
ncbi:MAG: YncE family protein [Thermoplasmata archaeon]